MKHPDPNPKLVARDLRFGYPARPDFLGPISLRIEAGECWGIVGPNGAGKSTLLRLLAGLAQPGGGAVHLDDRPLGEWPPRERAQRLAYLPQHPPVDLPDPVRSVVLLGRHPHRTLGVFESATDLAVAQRAMERAEVIELADRSLCTLSGGEAQRVHLAAALAQEAGILLLDEPTASLDWRHQLAIFTLLRDLAERDGLAVVIVTHDLNLARGFCSRCILLDDGREAVQGPVAGVLTPGCLGPVYGVEVALARVEGESARSVLLPLPPPGEGQP